MSVAALVALLVSLQVRHCICGALSVSLHLSPCLWVSQCLSVSVAVLVGYNFAFFAPGAGIRIYSVLDCHDGTDVGPWVDNDDALDAKTQIGFAVYASQPWIVLGCHAVGSWVKCDDTLDSQPQLGFAVDASQT